MRQKARSAITLEDLDLDDGFGQSATALDDEAGAEDELADTESCSYQYPIIDPTGHHFILIWEPPYQGHRAPVALSLWLAVASVNKKSIEDWESWKAVVSSQAAKWVDPPCLFLCLRVDIHIYITPDNIIIAVSVQRA